MGFPGYSDGKESACSAEEFGSTSGLRRSPGEGNGYPTPVRRIPTDRGAWQATVHWGLKESDMT